MIEQRECGLIYIGKHVAGRNKMFALGFVRTASEDLAFQAESHFGKFSTSEPHLGHCNERALCAEHCAPIPHPLLPLTSGRIPTKRLMFPSKRTPVSEFRRKRDSPYTSSSRYKDQHLPVERHLARPTLVPLTSLDRRYHFHTIQNPNLSYPPATGCAATAASPRTPQPDTPQPTSAS